MPMLRWKDEKLEKSTPSKKMLPEVLVSSPATILKVVVLPQPDGPSMVNSSSPESWTTDVVDGENLTLVGLEDFRQIFHCKNVRSHALTSSKRTVLLPTGVTES